MAARTETPLGHTVCNTVLNIGNETEQAELQWGTALNNRGKAPEGPATVSKDTVSISMSTLDWDPCRRRQTRS
jgi:hypothetical protein